MKPYTNKQVECFNEEAKADLRKYYRNIKYVPFTIACGIWGAAAQHVFGFWSAFSAIFIGGLFLGGYVKGVPKILGALFLAFLLPPLIATLIGN